MPDPCLGCNCRLQLHSAGRPPKGCWGSEWLGCNCRLQLHSAGRPPKGGLGSELLGCNSRLQLLHSASRPPKGGLGSEWLGCNSRLQLHSAGRSPTRGAIGVRMARLQFQIANALCRPFAQGGVGGPYGSAAIPDCKCTLQALRPRGGLEQHINTQMRPRTVNKGLGMQNRVSQYTSGTWF